MCRVSLSLYFVLSACHSTLSCQLVTLLCHISLSLYFVVSACHSTLSYQHVTLLCRVSLSLYFVVSACHSTSSCQPVTLLCMSYHTFQPLPLQHYARVCQSRGVEVYIVCRPPSPSLLLLCLLAMWHQPTATQCVLHDLDRCFCPSSFGQVMFSLHHLHR